MPIYAWYTFSSHLEACIQHQFSVRANELVHLPYCRSTSPNTALCLSALQLLSPFNSGSSLKLVSVYRQPKEPSYQRTLRQLTHLDSCLHVYALRIIAVQLTCVCCLCGMHEVHSTRRTGLVKCLLFSPWCNSLRAGPARTLSVAGAV